MTTLSPFDLPFIMERIGTLLDPKDLISCTLVCRNWHAQFAPFIWWYILEDCDALVKSIYYKHKSIRPQRLNRYRHYGEEETTSPMTAQLSRVLSADTPTFHLETEFIRIIIEYIQKIDNFSSVFHKHRRTRLDYSSFLSFLIMGWLCNNVKRIRFIYHEPFSFVKYQPNLPDMYKMSDQYYTTTERPDRVVAILERSRHLEALYLHENSLNLVYRWISLTNTPVSVPQWPRLTSVVLLDCIISQDFLNILLINSPSIQHLHLVQVVFRSQTQFEIFDFQRNHEANDSGSNSNDPLGNVYLGPPIRKLALKELGGATLERQMLFASQLQNLEEFTFIIFKENPPPVQFLGRGFQALRSLDLSQRERGTAGPSFTRAIRTAHTIEDLKMLGTPLTEPLCQAVNGNRNTLTSLHLNCCNSMSPDVLHHLLRSCSHLRTFSCLNGAKLHCASDLFEQPWACTEIESLAILPDCEPQDDTYTPAEARAAFFNQLSLLIKLRELSFAGGVGINGFEVEVGIYHFMRRLDKLEILSIKSPQLEMSANLTREHAEVIEYAWPKLKAIRGLYHRGRGAFVEYMREHRPEVNLSYA